MSDLALAGIDQFISRHTKEHVDAYVGPLGTVVDIGAHVGGFALRMAARGAREVVAYEAYPPNVERFLVNMRRNFLRNVNVHLRAVVHDDRPRVILRGFGARSTGQQSVAYHSEVPDVASVPCIRFDKVLEQFEAIDVLKIDVEGEEHNLFLETPGIKELLPRVRYLNLEIHELDNIDFFDGTGFEKGELQRFLRGQGFTEGMGGDFRSFNKRFEGGAP